MYDLDDSAAGEGQFAHVAQGAPAVGDLVVTFTLLTHQPGSADERDVLAMLRTARQLGGASGVGSHARLGSRARPELEWASDTSRRTDTRAALRS